MKSPSLAVAGLLLGSSSLSHATQLRIETRKSLNSRIANVHIDVDAPVAHQVVFTYGPCDSESQENAHHVIAQSQKLEGRKPHRLIWTMPKDLHPDDCISAWGESGDLLGRSVPQKVAHKEMRRRKRDDSDYSIPMNSSSGIDVYGPWFDGVALLEKSDNHNVDVEAAKAKEIAIVGAGMAGLTTYFILSEAGLSNLTILEASGRLGGRVRTEYLSGGPRDHSYAEMGPMRIPYQARFGDKAYNISDQAIFFRLVEKVNERNKKLGNTKDLINLIPFIQSSPNGLAYYQGNKLENGLPPTQADVAADPALGNESPEIPESAQELAAQLQRALPNAEFLELMATNFWQAHAEFLENQGPAGLPGDQWSEFAFLVNYLNATVFDANAVTGGYDWHSSLDRSSLVGMNLLPNAFHPLVDDITKFNAKVEKVQLDEKTSRLKLHWRANYTDPELESQSFDYAILSPTMPAVQKLRLPGLPFAMRNAVDSMPYASACKVALEYRTRFWEKFDNPIYGSCSTSTDIPGIGSVCYPSSNINGSGPASLLASYEIGRPYGAEWAGIPEEQHVQYVIDAMIDIHGEVARREFTGKCKRKCWALDEFSNGGWASPTVGNHETYLPSFFETHSHMIFVGEHTSYTHAWIASAIESAVRGSVQLLLELGLIDEAKDVVNTWMARWISVVSDLSKAVVSGASA
nr:putative L-amino-acid oxidase [Sarocladium sp.]